MKVASTLGLLLHLHKSQQKLQLAPCPPKWHRSSALLPPHKSPGFRDLLHESGGLSER